MDKKRFTLIELLAIIVILVIIAVVTVPIVLSIIDNSREKAKNSIIEYGKAVEFSYAQYEYEISIGIDPSESSYIANITDDLFKEMLSEGKVIPFYTSLDTETPIFLKVDFEDEKVVCKGGISENGKITVGECKINDDASKTYNYKEGKATEGNLSDLQENVADLLKQSLIIE